MSPDSTKYFDKLRKNIPSQLPANYYQLQQEAALGNIKKV